MNWPTGVWLLLLVVGLSTFFGWMGGYEQGRKAATAICSGLTR